MANTTNIDMNLTQESQLTDKYTAEILSFWKTGHFDNFTGVNDCKIAYATFIRSEYSPCLIIVPGRAESYLKYKELSFDLYQQGYSIFILDHRGQGLSDRLITDTQKGYVESFDFYSDDLHCFIQNYVLPHSNEQNKPYLLAHSMGGLIAARYMQRYPKSIKAAVLSSPMIGINTGIIPFSLAKILIKGFDVINNLFSNSPWYFVSQSVFKVKPLTGNPLTQSDIRYQLLTQLNIDNPEIQLGGVTNHWLNEYLKARSALFNNIGNLHTPILVLQAGKDSIVSAKAQNSFCAKLHQADCKLYPNKMPIVVEGALHELLFEQDNNRNEVLTNITRWYKAH
tara:strand:+ start:283 stop:1299 length:1017 start_codon:yes stop_codon:yes gene_type:complete